MDRANIETNQKLRTIEQNFITERAAREAGDKENQRLLTTSLIGDSGWEIAGVGFLFFGILFAGIPNELAKWSG